jgi:hypothetical protein
MSRVDFDRQEAIASLGRGLVVAHLRHFYEGDPLRETVNYRRSLELFARACVVAEYPDRKSQLANRK